jgi:hypothetical protein
MKLLDAQERLQHILTRILPCSLSARPRGQMTTCLPLKDHEIASLMGVSKQHFCIVKHKLMALRANFIRPPVQICE